MTARHGLRISCGMISLFPLLLGLQTPTASLPLAPAAPFILTPAQRQDLTCAAAFAIIASEQERGVTSALEYPTLVSRGRAFFVTTAERVVTETASDDAAVGAALKTIVGQLQADAAQSNDPAGVIDAVMEPCLERLDAIVPLPPPPSMLHCAIYVQLAYEDIRDREGETSTARDMKTLATVLESRARDIMRDEGLSGNEADRKFIETRETIVAVESARNADDDSPDIDFEHCFNLAKPAEKG